MNLPFSKKKEVKQWELLATTQLFDDKTNLLFVDQQGNFENIIMAGSLEPGIHKYIRMLKDLGTQSIVFNVENKKYLLIEYPETKIPVKDANIRQPTQGVSSLGSTQTVAVKSPTS